jgi:hypothetical protein
VADLGTVRLVDHDRRVVELGEYVTPRPRSHVALCFVRFEKEGRRRCPGHPSRVLRLRARLPLKERREHSAGPYGLVVRIQPLELRRAGGRLRRPLKGGEGGRAAALGSSRWCDPPLRPDGHVAAALGATMPSPTYPSAFSAISALDGFAQAKAKHLSASTVQVAKLEASRAPALLPLDPSPRATAPRGFYRAGARRRYCRARRRKEAHRWHE